MEGFINYVANNKMDVLIFLFFWWLFISITSDLVYTVINTKNQDKKNNEP